MELANAGAQRVRFKAHCLWCQQEVQEEIHPCFMNISVPEACILYWQYAPLRRCTKHCCAKALLAELGRFLVTIRQPVTQLRGRGDV
jgi:hypothetical protein